jgi:hypothetical protein
MARQGDGCHQHLLAAQEWTKTGWSKWPDQAGLADTRPVTVSLPWPPRAAATNLQRAQAFLQAFLERAADGHRFADAFHLRGERGVGLRKFLEGEARNLGHDVINARLETRGGFARDVVLEFVEQTRSF